MLKLSPLVNTFAVVILFSGIPIMLYLSWYFNITTNGIEAVSNIKAKKSKHFGLSKWLVFLSITVISIYTGASYFYSVKIEHEKKNDGTAQQIIARSMAVIPFTDASATQDQEYLANGFTEEVTSLLGSADKLIVVDLYSVNRLSSNKLDPVSIARKLKVDALLTGSIRNTGSNIRLRAELINVSDSKILWSDSYNRKFGEIFDLESTVARATLNSLIEGFISADELLHPSITDKVEAYRMYMKGREAFQEESISSLKEARKYFEQAIGIAPDFSKAFIALADTILLMSDGSKDFAFLEPEIATKLAQRYLDQALVKTQILPQAFATQGIVFERDGKLEQALASYNKATELNPSLAIAFQHKYGLLSKIGRRQEALTALQTALKLNPESSYLQQMSNNEYLKNTQVTLTVDE